ncbi:MAG: DUF1700 domain-containing protein [Methanomicrobiales archaeon]|nr:DUF1700 domain-containing protein [Methanomicrobiales archaeon]
MQQTETEYTQSLREKLEGTIPPEELEDLLSDYAEHFRMGRAEGRSEEDLWRSLGSPDDAAREIRAAHLVRKAESDRSWNNIIHAVFATLGLGLFNMVFVLVPFILLVVMLLVIFIVGISFAVFGPIAFVSSLLMLAGIPAPALTTNPAAGVFLSIGITSTGLLFIIGDYYLARFFYRVGIQYLKWNIRIITKEGE